MKTKLHIQIKFIQLSAITILSFLLSSNSFSQPFLGMIQKEGIFISDTTVRSKIDYSKLEKYFQLASAKPGENYVLDNSKNEFAPLTDVKVGQKFYVACWDNVTSEDVSGYVIYNFNDISTEFYPMLSNKTNLCKFFTGDYSSHNKNIVIISADPIGNKINYTPSVSIEMLPVFKKRILEDAKNFEVYADEMNTKKKFISEVKDENIIFFKGHFTERNEEQFFVSYLLQNSDSFVNANYIMNSKGEFDKYFSPPGSEFEFRQIEGICDYDNDGLDEIIMNVGYYEGGGYELWKYLNGKFVKVTEGFYFGV